MEVDPSEELSLVQKAKALHSLCTQHLPSHVTKLSNASRSIPSEKDFHFYYNFDTFKKPLELIRENTQDILENVGSSTRTWGENMAYPSNLDDAYDWMVNLNDEVFERFDVSADELTTMRKKADEGSNRSTELDGGFQLVYGRKKKVTSGKEKLSTHDSIDKKPINIKPRTSFHISTIPRPQETFNILVNNSNSPFEHAWLPKSEDGLRSVHPLEKYTALDFINQNSSNKESNEPGSIEKTPFKFIHEVSELKDLAAKLGIVDEFAVDLEHNQYRSFQGITCLMQISTRNEDFVIDTLKLKLHVGSHLREVFKDPSKKKVMHGADNDILWLQRDFGIYVCNLFDTGQASRVLKLERHSLKHLLYHYCGITTDKEYQNADWRLRPLPSEMLRYAREDTHYLLYIYDLMRGVCGGDSLLEVYKRSYDVCMQLYEKELLTGTSYLHIYGLVEAEMNARQLAVVSGLCEWRDLVARTQDESTGYILPNKMVLDIAKRMPDTARKLQDVVRRRYSYVERNLSAVVTVIRHSLANASAFEDDVRHLKEVRRARTELKQQHAADAEGGTAAAAHADAVIISGGGRGEASVVKMEKPTPAFGALFGSKKKRAGDGHNATLKIQDSLTLPFYTYSSPVLEKDHVKVTAPPPPPPPPKVELPLMSLPQLSSGFQQRVPDLKPFDYTSAKREVVLFAAGDAGCTSGLPVKRTGMIHADILPGRRRNAFPSTGNRTATFRPTHHPS